ncbi:hypothetical protein RSOLAG1IB_07966 [Rhizoctonia solani AG-1 IB]|uniref:SnoaL-like domain-containing protein n=1 Tax=Thanatephorus cucumeris (strain AG1-IB / isolate 7/3/14) TaxID=1108050 RepID=A0A0B7FGA1_THACB|nr:hypothetical protein RSOLAG1IB_07966 [Rhizoctonia solani AG-1 IB]
MPTGKPSVATELQTTESNVEVYLAHILHPRSSIEIQSAITLRVDMPPPAPPASAQGLSDEHLHAEEKWLSEWIQAANSMDWSQWERFWDDDAFLQFCDTPKLEGRDAIARHWRDRFSYLDRFEHTRILRRSFDVTSELIYQTELLNYRIKGDPKARDIEVHALAVIHKKVGSDTVTGFEAYFDQQPIVEVVRELRGRKRPE